MNAAIDPAHDSIPIHDRGTGQLRGVIHDRRVHIQAKTRRIGFLPTYLKCGVDLELREIVLIEAHGRVRRLRFVRYASSGWIETAAELVDLRAIADADESHVDMERREIFVELAQLRERFTEERSTDVSQPDREDRLR
jgi:hypothetical protein